MPYKNYVRVPKTPGLRAWTDDHYFYITQDEGEISIPLSMIGSVGVELAKAIYAVVNERNAYRKKAEKRAKESVNAN